MTEILRNQFCVNMIQQIKTRLMKFKHRTYVLIIYVVCAGLEHLMSRIASKYDIIQSPLKL